MPPIIGLNHARDYHVHDICSPRLVVLTNYHLTGGMNRGWSANRLLNEWNRSFFSHDIVVAFGIGVFRTLTPLRRWSRSVMVGRPCSPKIPWSNT